MAKKERLGEETDEGMGLEDILISYRHDLEKKKGEKKGEKGEEREQKGDEKKDDGKEKGDKGKKEEKKKKTEETEVDPKGLETKFLRLLDARGESELADKIEDREKLSQSEVEKLDRYRREFNEIHDRCERIRSVIKRGPLADEEFIKRGGGVEAKEFINKAIESSPELKEISSHIGGSENLSETILWNLEIMAIEEPEVIRNMEIAIEKLKETEEKFKKLKEDFIRLGEKYGISEHDLAEIFKEKDSKKINRLLADKIGKVANWCNEKARKDLDKLRNTEDLRKLLDEIDRMADSLAQALFSARSVESVKSHLEELEKELKPKKLWELGGEENREREDEEKGDKEGGEEDEYGTEWYAEERVEEKTWFKEKFKINKEGEWETDIFDADDKEVRCIIDKSSLEELRKAGYQILPNVEYYFEIAYEKGKKEGKKEKKGKKKLYKSPEEGYDLWGYVEIKPPYPEEAKIKEKEDKLTKMNREDLIEFIKKEGLKVKFGKDSSDREIREVIRKVLEEKEKKEFRKKLNDPAFVLKFLHGFIEERLKGDDAGIMAAKARIDALDDNQRKARAMQLV